MSLSEDAYKKFVGNHLTPSTGDWKRPEHPHYAAHEPVVDLEPPTPPSGAIIYTPHDCELPNPWETPIGAIWECHGYRVGRCCYDQWIVESIRGDRRWTLYKRNIR